jgi:hypothetical protein
MYKNIKRKLPLIGIAVICLLLLVLFIISKPMNSSAQVNSSNEAAEYLAEFGWKVAPEPVSIRFVEIPAEFTKEYDEYNNLQKSQGFDLSEFRSMTATVYTFRILNHPEADNVFANILVIDGNVVAGDIVSYAIDGFLTGL